MSDIKTNSIQTLTAAIVCIGFGLGMHATAVQADTGYLTNTAGEMVKSGSGECWRIYDGVAPPVEECGDVVAVAEEAPDPCKMDSDGDGIPDCDDKCPNTTAGAKVDANGCEIIQDLVLEVTADHFDFDKSDLKPAMMNMLDDVMAKIEASPGDEQLTIIGHTDSIGTDQYNQGLSERRARSAADYMIQKGFPQSKLSISGMGESQPVADNSTSAGRAKNRRVEIKTR